MTKEQKLLLLFVLIIAAGGGTFYYTKSTSVPAKVEPIPTTNTANNTPSTTVTPEPTPTASVTAIVAATITPAVPVTPVVVPVVKNKTIVEKLTYSTPDDYMEDITVTAVVDSNGIVVSLKFSYDTPTNPNSQQYLGNFSKAFSANTLIGKKIGTVKISRVGGASLTTGAFNRALDALATKV